MVEIGHAPDCPGCAWAALSAADRHLLDPYGVQRAMHHREPPPERPVRPPWWARRGRAAHPARFDAWRLELDVWRAQQLAVWAARRRIGKWWPCPRCGKVSCVAHYNLDPARPETPLQRDTRLFTGLFDRA